MSTYVSISTYITDSQLSNMNNKINSIDRWSTLINCSSFATDVWNTVSNYKVSAGFINTPGNLANSIKSTFPNSYTINAPIPQKTKDAIYYHTANGVQNCPNPTGTGGSSSFSTTTPLGLNMDNNYVNSFYNYNY